MTKSERARLAADLLYEARETAAEIVRGDHNPLLAQAEQNNTPFYIQIKADLNLIKNHHDAVSSPQTHD